MSKLLFNKEGRIENFTYIIARRDFYKYGIITAHNSSFKDNFNSANEISFQVYKDRYISNELWNRINDYNIVIIPELGDDGYFDMAVTLNEDENGVYKSITGTALAESELSHVKIYNYEVNTEAEMVNDETWNKDNLTILYRDLSQYQTGTEEYNKKKHTSLIHRLLDKVPNYSIEHVDSTLLDVSEWYQFSWDDNDLYSILTNDVAEQYHVLFKFNSKNRSISIYDLYSVCNNDNCNYRVKMQTDRNINTRYRGDFKRICPHCGSTNITPGYGKFTTIFVSKDNLSRSASVKSNKDSLVNTFKVKSGDELMDAAVVNQNPNGSNYIYQFSDENKAEMPPELVTALDNYNVEYNKYYNGDVTSGKGIYTFTAEEVDAYNNLINNVTGHFPEDILTNFINLKNTYTGYQSLASQYYSVMDLKAFYEYSMAPTPETNNDSLLDTKALLEANGNLSPIAVINPRDVTQAQVESGILQTAKCIINTALYELTVNTNPQGWTPAPTKEGEGSWRGTITIVSIEHKGTEEEANHTVTTDPLTIKVNGDVATYVKQKVQKLINRKNVQIKPLTDLVNLDQLTNLGVETQVEDTQEKQAEFLEQLQYYSLSVLKDVVYPSFQDVLSILQENGNKINSLFYDMYHVRLGFIEDAIGFRTAQIELIKIIQNKIERYRDATKEALNFQNYLGTNLYNIFCAYRREDTYQNSNYISDNLDNSQVMRRAGDLLDNAQKELYKSSHLQYEVSGNLNNLLTLPSFAPIIDDFDVGNWIHMTVDDKIYDLRLLSYQINFDELANIDVEFSTVEKIWSGASDIQSVLKAAGSIAGSYSNTQLQVKRYQESDAQVKSWVSTGLDATKTRFVDDSTTQEIVYDSSGFYARGFDEISSSYLPAQLKINKNGLYTTEDNWATLSTGVGAFTYYDPEENNGTGGYVDSYGVIAKTIVGKLILGENLKIINQNAKLKMDNNGLVISDGINSFTVNPNNNSKLLALSNINQSQDLLWVDSNGVLHIRGDGSGLDISSSLTNYSTTEQMNSAIQSSATSITSTVSNTYETKTDANNKKTALEQSISTVDQKADGISLSVSSIISNSTVSAAKIAALINDAGSTVEIEADHLNLHGATTVNNYFKIGTDGKMEATAGKFRGEIIADTGYIGGANGWTITTNAIYNGTNSMTSTTAGTFIGTAGIRQYASNNAYVNIQNGVVTAMGATITGTINATTGTFGSVYKIQVGTSGNNACLYYNMGSLTSTNSGFYLGVDGFALGGGNFKVTQSGEMTAKTGYIGPFSITNNGLFWFAENGDETFLTPEEIRVSSGGNDTANKHSIRLIPGSGKDVIKIYGKVNVFSMGYLGQATYDPETDITTFQDWGIYCSDKILIYSDNQIDLCAGDGKTRLLLGKAKSILRPVENSTYLLGDSDYRWKTIYCVDVNSTSDRKDKDILGDIDFASDFIMSLSPQKYMWKNGDHRRTRMGFIAQDVAKVCKNIGENLSVVSASYNSSTNKKEYFGEDVDDSLLTWGLKYDELIAPMVAVMQKQQKEIDELKKEIALLKQ
jgi:hypothetical protein